MTMGALNQCKVTIVFRSFKNEKKPFVYCWERSYSMCTHALTSHVLSFETITSHKTHTHRHIAMLTVVQ